MQQQLSMYLAGTIKKEHERADETYWTSEDMQKLRTLLSEYEVQFLNPAVRKDNLSDQRSVFGRDMMQVFCSDFVFVDVRDRRGLGVGAEMMWAKVNKIPLLLWAPKDSHYNKTKTSLLGVQVENWIHPFVESLADKIVEDLEEGARWIRTYMQDPSIEIKGIDFIHGAMQYYKDTQFPMDNPMQEIIFSGEKLKKRFDQVDFLAKL